MIKIKALYKGEEKTLSICEWSLITGASYQKIKARYLSKIERSNEYVVCLKEDEERRLRHATICKLYNDGFITKEIGERFNISRQRVQQILKTNGLTMSDSGRYKEQQVRGSNRFKEKEGKILKTYMCSRGEWRVYRGMHQDIKQTPLRKYKNQRDSAKHRGIEWKFNINDWWNVWEKSGKWGERGRRVGGYVMARYSDTGAYSPENVYITTCTGNIVDGYEFRKDLK